MAVTTNTKTMNITVDHFNEIIPLLEKLFNNEYPTNEELVNVLQQYVSQEALEGALVDYVTTEKLDEKTAGLQGLTQEQIDKINKVTELENIDLLNTVTLVGLFVGAMLPFLFGALTMESVGKAANEMIEEVRRQFRETPGIMEGTAKPDYKKCVDISTDAALKEMILPGVLALAFPILIGLLLGSNALAGLLAGSVVTGFLMAVFMSNSGGAWDNAKKYIEEGNHGGKGSEAHKAAVVGDTVGDPFKDTSGPSMNILIKLMSIVSLVFAPIILKHGGILINLIK